MVQGPLRPLLHRRSEFCAEQHQRPVRSSPFNNLPLEQSFRVGRDEFDRTQIEQRSLDASVAPDDEPLCPLL